MKLLITGANGFLGRYVVTEAVRRGHSVRALVRPSTDVTKLEWYARDRVEVARADLRSRRGLADVVRGVDCVLHLAAAKSGDLYAQYAGTVVATENLLAAMTEAGVRRIVLVSSFSVYDYLKLHDFSLLDENSPVEEDAFDRDEYAQTKLVQERLVREHAKMHDWDCVILRPGVIWGKDNLFTARLGIQAGRVWVRTGTWARLPLTYVENCAESILLAAESRAAQGQTFNVVDDERPTQRRFASLIRTHFSPRPTIVPVPLWVMRLISGLAWHTNKRVFGGRAKVPGLFVPARLAARCRPLRFSNQKIKNGLGWKPKHSLHEALDRSTGATRPEAARPRATSASPRAEVSVS
jgi:nucleoside-diphosphate-sugar epimerase